MPFKPSGKAVECLRRVTSWLLWSIPLECALIATSGLAAEPTHNVLVLYSDNRLLPGLNIIYETIDATLRAESGVQVDLFNEFLDLESAREPRYLDDLVEFLRKKYAGMRIDAIIVVRNPALKFVLDRRDQFLAGVPVVYVQVARQELADLKLPPDVIGAALDLHPEKTIELALKLNPAAKRLAVITGSAPFDRGWERLLRAAFKPFETRITVEYWAGLPLSDVLTRLSRLSRDSIVFLPGMRQDPSAVRYAPAQVAAEIVAASPAPVYGNAGNFAPVGTSGGFIPQFEESARRAGLLTAALLRGEKPETLSPVPPVRNEYVLNAYQLNRFGVSETDLPAGTILKYRQPGLWETYRWQISAVTALVLLQAALIAALLVQGRNRRRAHYIVCGSRPACRHG